MTSTDHLLDRIRDDWARVFPDLNVRPMLLPILLNRLSVALSRRVEETYQRHGLNPATWDLLLTLRRSAPEEGLTPGELSQLTAVTGPTITNRIDRLVERHLAERQISPTDRRSWRVRLTPAGFTLVDNLLPLHVQNETELLSALPPDDLMQLERMVQTLIRSLES